MPAGIVLAGRRAGLAWHGTTLLRRVAALVARGTAGPVVVVRAPGQELPELPGGTRVVEGTRGPLGGLLAGLQAVDAGVAFVATADLPLLHPDFVAAVCRGLGGADVALPDVGGERRPLPAAYRPALAPLVAELVDADYDALLERCALRPVATPPHPESVRDDEAALAAPQPLVHARAIGGRSASVLRAATLGAAAAALGVELGAHMLAAINGERAVRDPLEPLAEGDEVAFMAADVAG